MRGKARGKRREGEKEFRNLDSQLGNSDSQQTQEGESVKLHGSVSQRQVKEREGNKVE